MKNVSKKVRITIAFIIVIVALAFLVNGLMKKTKKRPDTPWISYKINATGDSTIETNDKGERIAWPIKKDMALDSTRQSK